MTTNKHNDRSLFVTIFATILGLLIGAITLLFLPIDSVTEGVSFAIGILLVVVCILTAIQGKKGTIAELIFSLSFWR